MSDPAGRPLDPPPPAWTVPLTALLGSLAAAGPVHAYDFFWHLATGRWIHAAGTVPRADPLSFTAAGTPWVDHGWLFQWAVWPAWAGAGIWAPWLLRLVGGAAIGALLAVHLRRARVPAAMALVLAWVALAGAAFRLTERPELLSLVLAVAFGVILLDPRPEAGQHRWAPLAVAPLAALWANLHAAAVLAPALAGVAAVGTMLDRRRQGQAPAIGGRAGVLTAAALLAALALVLNPYGLRLLTVPPALTALMTEPWAFNPEWTRPGPRDFPGLYAAVGLLLLVALTRRGRNRMGPLLAGSLAAALALRYVRNVGLFYVLLPFAIASPLAAWTPPRLRSRWLAVAVGAGAAAWLGTHPAHGRLGPGVPPGRFPVEACDFVERQGIEGRMFHEVAFGGYLAWRFTERPVFVDGRNEIYAPLLRRIHAALAQPERFWELTAEWGLDAALLRYPPGPVPVAYRRPDGGVDLVSRSWSEVYFPAATWALVHWDDTAMVRVRRAAHPPVWLASREYRLNPDDLEFLLAEARAGRVGVAELLTDVRRKRREDPGCRRARDLEALLLRLFPEASGDGGAAHEAAPLPTPSLPEGDVE